jgi:GTP-binding protein
VKFYNVHFEKTHVTGLPPTSPTLSPQAESRPAGAIAMAWAHTARFLTTSSQISQLPASDLTEIAFVGRSNAGKSTAINTLTQQRQLAFASRTPGRTQHINLFEMGSQKHDAHVLLADLPGYGYATVEKTTKERWQEVMAQYLLDRTNLRGVVLMLDSRLGFTELDCKLLDWIEPRVATGQVKLLALLTKVDKLNYEQKQKSLAQAQEVLGAYATDQSDIGVALFSALKKIGVEDLALTLLGWVRASALAATSTKPDVVDVRVADVATDPKRTIRHTKLM